MILPLLLLNPSLYAMYGPSHFGRPIWVQPLHNSKGRLKNNKGYLKQNKGTDLSTPRLLKRHNGGDVKQKQGYLKKTRAAT